MSLKDDLELNTPRRTPGHATKSHVVKTNVNGKPKMIRFGEQGASTAGAPSPNDSEKTKAKRKAFKDRHAKNIAKGPASAAYWANKVKWAKGGPVGVGGPLEIAKDVLRDAASGIASPIISSSGWLMDKYLTDYTEEERDARYERLSDATNYTPRTKGGQFVNETSMQTLEDMMGKAATFYGGRTHMLDPEVRQTASTINQAYQGLDPGTRDTIGHALVAGEAFVPFLGKAAGAAKRALSTDTPATLLKDAAGQVPAEEAYAPLQERLEEMGARQLQVKEPGGNFPNLKFQSSPESVIETVIDKTFIGFDGYSLNRPGEELVSKWFRNRGKKYITKEMGTGQGDSLVKMFDNYELDAELDDNGFGIAPTVHLDPALNLRMFDGMPRSARERVAREGRPITSENPLAQRYERLSDEAIITTTLDDLSASDRRELVENQPFYATAPGDTVVHFLKNDQVGTSLGLDIIADELSNMVDPDNLSGLPAEFLLSEKNLNKLTLEQASRKVGEARVWRKSEADRVEMEEFTESLNVAYEDPEFVNKSTAKKKDRPAPGMKWVVIDDVSDDASMRRCNIIGEKGGWCTETIGYAETYTKEDRFIVSALDNNNQPQAQVALEYNQNPDGAMVTDVLEVAPPGNRLDSDKVTVRMERDPEYLNQIMTSTTKYLNNLNETDTLGVVKLGGHLGGVHGQIADVQFLSGGDRIPNTADLNLRFRMAVESGPSPSLKEMLNKIYMGETSGKGDFNRTVIQLLKRPTRVGQELPRFMTNNDLVEFIKENADEKTAAGLTKRKGPNDDVFVEQITSMRDELRLLGQGRGPSLADLMSMTSTDLVAVRTAMRQRLDRVLDNFGNDQEWQSLHPNSEDLIRTVLTRRQELIDELEELQSYLGDGFTVPERPRLMNLSELNELVREGDGYVNQRMDAQIDADGILDDDIELDAEIERQADLRSELMRLQNERGDVDFAYTEDEMLNMSYNDLAEIIDQYNDYPPEADVLQQILDEPPVDRTLAEYRDIAYTNNFVSEADRLQGFHAMLQTSGWDETGQIRVNLRDPQMNEGIWPDGKENLLVEAKEVMEDYQLGSRTIDETMDDLFLIASDRDREFIVNNYSDIKLMIMGDDFMTAADYNINNFARGGAVTYDPDEIRRLSENLLAGNYYKGGPVTYDHNEIKKLSKQLMETYNV